MNTTAINWQDCVRQSNNKADLAEELLNMFSLELPTLHQHILSTWKKNQLDELKQHIHKLHGACCYCGANNLKKLLHELEDSIATLDNTALQSKMGQLDTEIQKVKRSLEKKDYR